MPRLHHLVLAGCGGMGRRHLRSYRVLGEAEPGRAELAAVVDPELERAEFVAAEAEQLLGRRPRVFTSLEAAASAVPELDVVDIVAAASAHHRIAQAAFAAGMHVLCEKPMAPTVAACRAMQRAAEQAGRVLSVAENYRRDPISRLARALVDAGAIGRVRSLVDLSGSGGSRGSAGPWRYRRTEGGPILEAGVHNADMQQYLAGAATRVSGQVRLNEPRRIYRDTPLKVFHDHYAHTNPEVAPADAPDLLMATGGACRRCPGSMAVRRLAARPAVAPLHAVRQRGADRPAGRAQRPSAAACSATAMTARCRTPPCWRWRRTSRSTSAPRACSAASEWRATRTPAAAWAAART